jgi:hypothetical protein
MYSKYGAYNEYRRTAARPATETKVRINMTHATQLSAARRLVVRATGLRSQPVSESEYTSTYYLQKII